MDRHTELALIDELIELHDSRTPFLDEHWHRPTLERYVSPSIFEREQAAIHRRLPHIVAHVSELPNPGDFLTVQSMGHPLLLTRDESGAVRAFYNVCRHRGAKLVRDQAGCQHRFSCPYHAWTWDNTGTLIAVPHEKTGFPGLDREAFRLRAVAAEEFAGWIWVSLAPEGTIDVAAHLGDLAADLLAMDAGNHEIVHSDIRDTAANWKILVEGGIESYHFRVAHRDTIAPLFLDNLSSYRTFGPHMRSILPRATLPGMKDQPVAERTLGRHANVLYSLFPGSQFLVQEDHFIWIQGIPVAPDRTLVRLATMVRPQDHTPDRQSYWDSHHRLTTVTLDEDFVLAEEIQQGLASGANEHLNFGRFEGALAAFNATVEAAIA